MARQTNAPKVVTWIISLVLFIVAIVAHFGIIQVSADIATWSWIIGYALLLVAVQVKGL
ncbi:MAG: hypothetical protein ABR524_09985 [Thermoanaerobaculia bacterium]